MPTPMTPAIQPTSLRTAARDAFLYALPLTEIANVRANLLGAGIPAGRFFALKGLATPKDRFVTTPNVDTIYANTFIDLTNGPATLTVPPLGDRYGSVALMDMFSNNFAVLGTRTTGTFTLVGPNDPAPTGAVRSATPWVWALARVVVNGPDDVANAKSVLSGFRCEAAPHQQLGAGRKPYRGVAGLARRRQRAADRESRTGNFFQDFIPTCRISLLAPARHFQASRSPSPLT